MLEFASFVPEIAVKRYKLKFTNSVKKYIENIYLKFIKDIEGEMKKAISTIENYEKALENDIKMISNTIQLPISKGFCDELCLKCNNDGSYSLNNVGYHKSCLNCLGLLENMEICTHCQSKVNVNTSNLSFTCKGCKEPQKCTLGICKNFHCFNWFYFCERCKEIHCKKCFKGNNKQNYNEKIKLGVCNDILQTQKENCNIEKFKKKAFSLKKLLVNSGSKNIIKNNADEDSVKEYLKVNRRRSSSSSKIIIKRNN